MSVGIILKEERKRFMGLGLLYLQKLIEGVLYLLPHILIKLYLTCCTVLWLILIKDLIRTYLTTRHQ